MTRLEISERGSREFYDEMYNVASNYNKFIKKPTKKPRGQSKVYFGYCVWSAIVIALFMYVYSQEHAGLFLLLAGMMLVCGILFAVMGVAVNKRIKLLMSETGTKVFEIDENGVRLKDDSQDIKLSWDNIANVLVNRNSIVFLPANDRTFLISVYSEYKDEVLKGIEGTGHMDLVVENA